MLVHPVAALAALAPPADDVRLAAAADAVLDERGGEGFKFGRLQCRRTLGVGGEMLRAILVELHLRRGLAAHHAPALGEEKKRGRHDETHADHGVMYRRSARKRGSCAES